jgi:L-aminopeptidase/D-esterase-like protein
MQYLEERSIGYQTSAAKVPIVPAAIIYDLGLGDSRVRPDRAMGYQACLNSHSGEIAEGSVGVGAGASVGKLLGITMATKGGVGTASKATSGGVVVAALVAVNAFGDVIEPETRKILAGARDPAHPGRFIDSAAMIKEGFSLARRETDIQNTTLGVVATNVKLSKRQATKVAQMAQAGFARTIAPIHSTVDGDLIFSLSAGDLSADVNTVGLLAEEVVAAAVLRAVRAADGLGLLPDCRDLHRR